MPTSLERRADGTFLPRDEPINKIVQEQDDARAAEAAERANEPPPEKVEKRPAPKKEPVELGPDAKAFMDDFVSPVKKTKADDVDAKAKEAEDKAKKEAEEKAAKAKLAQRAKPVRAEPLTAAQIADATAEGVARAMRTKPKEELPEKKDAPSQFTPSDDRKIAVLGQLEKMYPDKYKGAPDKFKASLAKISAYAEKWSKDNPSKEFNEDDEEHTEFFDKNNLHEFWDQEDFDEAKTEMRVQKALEEERRSTNKRLSDYDRKFKATAPETIQAIDAEQVGAAKQYWKLLGDDFAAVMKEDGTVDQEKAKELRESDPIGFDERLKAATRLDVEVAEIYRLMNALIEQDPKNRLHTEISNFAAAAEQRLAGAPKEDRLDHEGRDFLPADKYYALSKEKREASNWTFTARDLAVLRASHLARETQQIIDREEEKLKKYAAARGLVPKNGGAEARKEPDPELEDNTDPDDEKPVSPTGGSETKLSTGRGAGGKGSPAASNSFFSTNW